jgi:hypothetical protein
LVEAIRRVAAAEGRIAVEGQLAARAREVGSRSAADRHRRRMVQASVEKEVILDRHRPRKIALIRRPTLVSAAGAEVDAEALAA